jgi:hypothetical protein
MTLPIVPAWAPDARARLLLRIGAIIGALIVALWLPALLSAYDNAIEPTRTSPYTWHNESAIFLANSYSTEATCTVAPATSDARTFTLAARSYTTNLSINGVHIDRWFTGDATVTCEHTGVYLTKGPMIWLYPIGANAAIPAAGILLIAAWWLFDHRRKTQPQQQ